MRSSYQFLVFVPFNLPVASVSSLQRSDVGLVFVLVSSELVRCQVYQE